MSLIVQVQVSGVLDLSSFHYGRIKIYFAEKRACLCHLQPYKQFKMQRSSWPETEYFVSHKIVFWVLLHVCEVMVCKCVCVWEREIDRTCVASLGEIKRDGECVRGMIMSVFVILGACERGWKRDRCVYFGQHCSIQSRRLFLVHNVTPLHHKCNATSWKYRSLQKN